VRSDVTGIIDLPDFPGETDWGLRLTCLDSAPGG
jgi:hypothetical protein